METKTIYKSLIEAHKKIEPVTKDAKNPFFKSSYATLGAVIDSVKQILLEHDIYISQPVNGNMVYTILTNSNGEQISDGGTPIICAKENDPQAQGSAITYARRYGLMSILSLSAEDDDGEGAMNRKSERENGVKTTQTEKPTTTTPKDPNPHLEVFCKKCNQKMTYLKSGKKQDGSNWDMYVCSDKSHEPTFL